MARITSKLAVITSLLLLILLFAVPSWAVNSFGDDTNCVALYLWNSNGNDSIGGNHLTVVSAPGYGSGVCSTQSYSSDWESGDNDRANIANGDLDIGFPGRHNGGESDLSVCFWYKPESLPGSATSATFATVTASGSTDPPWNIRIRASDAGPPANSVTLRIGDPGTGYDQQVFGTALEADHCYHIGVTYEHSTQNTRIVIWDDTDEHYHGGTDKNGETDTLTYAMDTGASQYFCVSQWPGNTYPLDGVLEELVIFKDVLTVDEIEDIKDGTYGAAADVFPLVDAGLTGFSPAEGRLAR